MDSIAEISIDEARFLAFIFMDKVGLNKNTHGLLRQYWPKKTDFKKVSAKEVKAVIVQLNDRPRKKLNFKTPAKLMADHMAAIAA